MLTDKKKGEIFLLFIGEHMGGPYKIIRPHKIIIINFNTKHIIKVLIFLKIIIYIY